MTGLTWLASLLLQSALPTESHEPRQSRDPVESREWVEGRDPVESRESVDGQDGVLPLPREGTSLHLEVRGSCVDKHRLEAALSLERAARPTLPLAVRLVCEAQGLDIRLQNAHSTMAFGQPLDFGTGESRERGIALVIAERDLELQPEHAADDPTVVDAGPDVENREERPRRSLPPIISYSPEDFAWEGDEEEVPLYPRSLATYGGFLVRDHASRATLVGAAVHADIRHLQLGIEVTLAGEDGRTARDIGGTIGFLVFQPTAHMVSANLGLKMRLGYQSYNELQAFYGGGSAFVTLEMEPSPGFRARLVPEVGQGGFARREEFAQIQTLYFALTFEVGVSSRAERRAARGGDD